MKHAMSEHYMFTRIVLAGTLPYIALAGLPTPRDPVAKAKAAAERAKVRAKVESRYGTPRRPRRLFEVAAALDPSEDPVR